LPLVIEWSPVGKCVDIFFRLFQEIKGRVGGCRPKPLHLVYVGFFRQKDDDTDPGWADNM